MDPLKIDLVLTRILTHLSHPADLKNCRLVNQYWNVMTTSVFNDRGATCVVSDENYAEFFQDRVKNIAGLNLTLNITGQQSGRSQAVFAMTKELQQDQCKTGTGAGSYCVKVKTINYRAKITSLGEHLDSSIFWPLVEATAPNLERLFLAGAVKPDPGHPVADNYEEDIPAPPEPTTLFPALKSVIFDIRRHNRSWEFPIPQKLAEILNNAPALEELKLVLDQKVEFDRHCATQQIWFTPTEVLPKSIERIAGQLKRVGLFIKEGQIPRATGHVTLEAVRQTSFQIEMFPFEILATNASTLTSLEYTFLVGIKLQLLKFVAISAPLRLENVTHFGFYYRDVFTQPRCSNKRPITPMPPISQMIVQLQRTCLMCPNLKILFTDINVCEALSIFENHLSGLARRFNDGDEHDLLEASLESKKLRKEKNPSVTTLEVAVYRDMIPHQVEDLGFFVHCMTRFWPDKFPALHKLIVKVNIWRQDGDDDDDDWVHGDAVYRLSGILNIPGITDLEIVEYGEDWIGQGLAMPSLPLEGYEEMEGMSVEGGYLANLQQGLRRLRLSATQTTTRCVSKLPEHQHKRLEQKCLKWPEGVLSLCGAFQALEEVVIDRRVFWSSAPVLVKPGITITDQGVKITVV